LGVGVVSGIVAKVIVARKGRRLPLAKVIRGGKTGPRPWTGRTRGADLTKIPPRPVVFVQRERPRKRRLT
jgi:hypothetical protein